jgi:hypothetical protein
MPHNRARKGSAVEINQAIALRSRDRELVHLTNVAVVRWPLADFPSVPSLPRFL